MKKEYDFTKSVKNPYTKKMKKQISLNVNIETIEYFKLLSQKVNIPYQTLINSFLTDCVNKKIEPKIQW